MASIFYEGDLQSGIGLALSESKSVVCFIRDEGEESSKWEHEYLEDAQIRAALADRAITLRILAGSEEAAFFSAYYSIQTVPALTIIHNGALTLDLKSGQEKAAFKSGILTSLIAASPRTSVSTTLAPTEAAPSVTTEDIPGPSSSQEHRTTSPDNQPLPQHPDESREEPTSAPSQDPLSNPTSGALPQEATSNPASSSSSQQSVVQRLLDERRRKLEIDKRQKEEAEKADRKAEAEARKESISIDANSAKAKQATFAQEQRKRNIEARQERDRVLRQIEHDKLERKEREERRKALAKAEIDAGVAEDLSASQQQDKIYDPPVKRKSGELDVPTSRVCAIQVRLFDGSTIRNKFSADQNLIDIRQWVDEQRPDDAPFTFKQILSPSPNRSLTISEEKESLMQLRLVPSATLIMVPIQGYTAAYSSPGPSIVSRITFFLYNALFAFIGLVSGAFSTFLGFGQTTPQRGEPTSDRAHPKPNFDTPESGIKIRTLHDKQKEQDKHQLYNGNHVNVEPRNDDPDKDE